MAKKTTKPIKPIAFHKQTIAELRALVVTVGCGNAQARLKEFERALKRSRISARTPLSAGTILRLSGLDALQWLADYRASPGDQDTVRLADNIRLEIENNLDALVAEKLDAQLEG